VNDELELLLIYMSYNTPVMICNLQNIYLHLAETNLLRPIFALHVGN